MVIEQQQLKAFLFDAGLLTQEQFEAVRQTAQQTGKTIEDVLVQNQIISPDDLARLKAYILGIPFINLEKETIDPNLLRIIPEPVARSHNIIVFKKSGRALEVAMLDPEDLKTIEFVAKKAKLKILPRLTTVQSIRNALNQYQQSLQVEFGDIIEKSAEELRNIPEGGEEETAESRKELERQAQDLPVIRIVDTLIKHAILQSASDIHIEPTEKDVLIRYRIDGILRDAMTLPLSVKSGLVARIKVLSNLKLDEHRLPQDGRFKIETSEFRYSVRVSVLPVLSGEKVVMRLLSENAKGYSLESLGFREQALESVERALRKPLGMILVTGPTGSGKTTTLYSMMEILNTPEVNISTVEDPIEYCMHRVNQTQINSKIGLTFANGLRTLLRQDPDIIMVGEIRDNETAALAINAALTGHLVLSTLHTNSAAGAIPRLIDMKIEPFLLASTLNVIIAQRLVRKLSEDKEKYFLNEADINDLSRNYDLQRLLCLLKKEKIIKEKERLEDVPFYRAKPGKKSPDGYQGRIGIYEILNVTETIKELIQKGAISDQIQGAGQKQGMKLMIEDGFIKAAQGITTLEEVLRVVTE